MFKSGKGLLSEIKADFCCMAKEEKTEIPDTHRKSVTCFIMKGLFVKMVNIVQKCGLGAGDELRGIETPTLYSMSDRVMQRATLSIRPPHLDSFLPGPGRSEQFKHLCTCNLPPVSTMRDKMVVSSPSSTKHDSGVTT